MRASPSLILLCTAAVVWVAASGCDDAKCDACANCARWQTASPFFGEMTGGWGSCGDASQLLSGNIRIDVSDIADDASDPPQTLIDITLTDEQGNWTMFSGRICETADTKAPYTNSFTVFYIESALGQGFQVNNQLAGIFSDADAEHDLPAFLDANYSISFTDLNNANNNCNLQARLQAEW